MNLKLSLHELEPLILIHSINDKIFFLKIKGNIKSSYFENEKIGTIFEVISNFHSQYNTIPKEKTLLTLFKRKFESKAEEYNDLIKFLFSYNEPYDKEFIIDNTINFIKQAKVIESIKTSIPMIEQGKYGEIYENIKKAIIVDFDKKIGIDFINKAIEKAIETNAPRISTGFNQLDMLLGGGFEQQCLYVFSGVYGIGKSIWLQNIAVKLLMNGKNIIFYTLELSETAATRRLLSIYTQINSGEFIEKMDDIHKQFETLKMITDSNIWIKEFPTKSANTNHFRAHMEELKTISEFNPDIIIVDYCNIMDTLKTVSAENTYVRSQILYEELRSLAQELSLPIVTAAQINRGGMDERKGGTKQLVTGANISDSMGINMTVDGHFIINQTLEEKQQGIMRLFIDKNRQGGDKLSKTFGIKYETLTITEDVTILEQ
jgi:replicative DNA helicase